MKQQIGTPCENRTLHSVSGKVWATVAAFLSLIVFPNITRAESFTPPYSGILYLQCVGGSAGATSQFGLGSSPANFTPYLSNLPEGCPDTEVKVGPVTGGQPVEFGISTLWGGQTYWAFSFNTDQASIVSFTDVCNTLGMNGNIIQQTSSTTWTMHLNDAAHYTISQCEANNILIQIRLAATNTCSLQSLSGPYSYVFTGSGKDHADRRGFSAVGLFVSDGNGNLTGTDTTSNSGVITTSRTWTGTYNLNADCTGTATFTGIGPMYLVLTNNNQNVNLIQTDQGSDVLGTAQQQFH